MKWFKHDSDANNSGKLSNLLIEHGAQGFGLYWLVVELIASKISGANVSFELEHSVRVIAHKAVMDQSQVQAILDWCVEEGLFDVAPESKRYRCLAIAERLDDSTSKNPLIQQVTKQIRESGVLEDGKQTQLSLIDSEGLGETPNDSEKLRLDKTRLDKSNKGEGPPPCPYSKIVDLYHEHCPMMTRVVKLSDTRKANLRARWREDKRHQNLEFWERYFKIVSQSDFLTGGNERDWTADFEWLIKQGNFIKVIEGKYP